MTTINLSLSDDMVAFLADQSSRDGFESADEYLRALIHEQQKRQARRELEAKLREGLESGPAEAVTPEFWARIRQEALDGLSNETIQP